MPDYYCQVSGEYNGALGWSFGQHMTTGQSEDSLATQWLAAWEDAWTSSTLGLNTLYPATTTINGVSVATLNATMHETSKTRRTISHPGTSTADTLPYQEAIVVSWRGPNIQRHGRGRWYLPALAEDQVNGDVLITAAANRIKDAMNDVYNRMQGINAQFFVTNKHPLKDGTPAFQHTTVTTPLVALKPARQSRRVRKVPTSYV